MRSGQVDRKVPTCPPMNITTNLSKLIKRLIEAKAETIKLGMDVHASNVVVAIQIDRANPLRAVKLSYHEVVQLVQALVAGGIKVYSCFECGPCGFHLH